MRRASDLSFPDAVEVPTRLPGASPQGLVLGIDPSLTSWAAVLLDITTLEYSTFLLQPKSRGVERLSLVQDYAAHVIAAALRRGRLRKVAIEGYSHASKFAQHKMGECGAATRIGVADTLGLKHYKTSVIEIAPTRLKKYVTGKGNSPKKVMLLNVYKKWDEEFTDDNLGDAYALARAARDVTRKDTDLVYEGEALSDYFD